MADADVKRRTHRAEVHWQTVSRMEHVSRFNHLVKEWGRGGRGTFWEQVWLAPVSHREANWSRQCHRQERPVTMVVAERKKWPIPSYSHHTDHHFSTFLRHSWDVLACRVVWCHLKELSPRVFRFAFASEFLNLGNPGGVQPILVACCWLSCLTSRSHLAQGTGQDPATAILCWPPKPQDCRGSDVISTANCDGAMYCLHCVQNFARDAQKNRTFRATSLSTR